jgi:transcriptional regulator of met regulon
MVQVLHLSNGDTINEALRAEDNRIGQLLKKEATNAELLEEIYLAALARQPTVRESAELLSELAKVEDAQRRELVEDILWGVLSSREFLFNH